MGFDCANVAALHVPVVGLPEGHTRLIWGCGTSGWPPELTVRATVPPGVGRKFAGNSVRVTVDAVFGGNGYVVLTGYTTWAWATATPVTAHATRARATVVTRMVIVVTPLIA
jgi:hypothetical protein